MGARLFLLVPGGAKTHTCPHGRPDTRTCLLPHPRDKVAPLFYSALELLSTLVASYAPQLPYSVLTQGLEPIMPTLLHRVGNNNSRIQVRRVAGTIWNGPAATCR